MVFKNILLISFSLFLLFISISRVFAQSLEQYCENGYYKIPNEPVCSRAPKCGGVSFEQAEKLPFPDPQACMGDGKACNGWIPLCCYEMARTGDFLKCTGYWERLWCTLLQCDIARQNGASDSQCPDGNCHCGHAFKHYCEDKQPPVPLEDRLAGKYNYGEKIDLEKPTPTFIPTHTPLPTNTPVLIPTRIPLPTIKKPLPRSTPFLSSTLTPTKPIKPSPLPRFKFPEEKEKTPSITPKKTTRIPIINPFESLAKIFKKPDFEIKINRQFVISTDLKINELKKAKRKIFDIDRKIESNLDSFFRKLISRIVSTIYGL